MSLLKRFSAVCVFAVAATVSSVASAAFIEFELGGANAAAIQATVDNFRAALGNPNNGNAPGPLNTGRREINWDGGGTATTPAGTPFNGFQGIRGALFTTPGTGFVQAPPSGGAGGGLATFFNNATYGTTFTTFSAPRLFTPAGSTITDVTFFVPGIIGPVPSTVTGFGAIFSDVDIAGSSSLTFFDVNGAVLFSDTSIAPGALSFAGALDPNARIARVRIVSGNTALGPNDGGAVDVVALDDFIFAEPRAIPEPAPIALLLLAVTLVAPLTFRRATVRVDA